MGEITFTGDSGAVAHVVTEEAAKAFKIHPTPMSKAGIGFTAANGSRIKNLGAKKLKGVTGQWDPFNMQVNVTDAKKNLASFPQMEEEGNDVFLSKKGSWIKHEGAGMMVPMRLKPGGTPEFDLFVKRASETGQFGVLNVDGEADIKEEAVSSSFQRLEKLI